MIDEEINDVESYSTEAKANMRSRSERRDDLLRLITKNGKTISKDHLLGVFMIRAHVSMSTTYQYLQELKMARLIAETNEQLLPMEQYLADQQEDITRLKELAEDA